MKKSKKTTRVGFYFVVGITAAATHSVVLIVLNVFLSLWISNLLGFLSASLVSYIGHSKYTFNPETKGNNFARRWLIYQFTINLCLSILLPLVLITWGNWIITKILLILSPTIMNALIWSQAAKFSARRHQKSLTKPILHADDLGLTSQTNIAILDLVKNGNLDSASLLINGNAVESAIKDWKKEKRVSLYLHFCLTEGPALSQNNTLEHIVNKKGVLHYSFARLVLVSLIPRLFEYRRIIEHEIQTELIAQIKHYKLLTGENRIALDGHQHVHLIPIVLSSILKVAKEENINWIRTASEPLLANLPMKSWVRSFSKGGLLKWLVLLALSFIGKQEILKEGIQTNSAFAGVLFTGQMDRKVISSAWKELSLLKPGLGETDPMILCHPASCPTLETQKELINFPLSRKFLYSNWREKEWIVLKTIILNMN